MFAAFLKFLEVLRPVKSGLEVEFKVRRAPDVLAGEGKIVHGPSIIQQDIRK